MKLLIFRTSKYSQEKIMCVIHGIMRIRPRNSQCKLEENNKEIIRWILIRISETNQEE